MGRPAVTGAPFLSRSKPLYPGPHFNLERPRAAVLPQDIDVGLRDGIRVQHAVGLIAVLRALRRSYAAVDDEMRDVNALGSQFPRRALRKTTESEFTHRKRRRIREPLDACRRAGQQDGAATAWSHELRSLLCDQESAEGIDREGARYGGRIEFRERSLHAGAGIVDHRIDASQLASGISEQCCHSAGIA